MKIIESENYYHREILPGIEVTQEREGGPLMLNGQCLDELTIDISREKDMSPRQIITITFTYTESI